MDELEFYGTQPDALGEVEETARPAESSYTGRKGSGDVKFELPRIGAPDGGSGKNKAEKKTDLQGKMIIGLSGVYAGGGAASSAETVAEDDDIAETLAFLRESIDEYRKYVENIGHNGMSAPNLNYYRDDIQDIFDLLKYDESVNLKELYGEVVRLDMQLRGKATIHVREIGYNNYKQYRIINDPPPIRWWWYLNNVVTPPAQQTNLWQFWKR